MRYTRQQRLDIGKDIYDDHLSYREAAKKYGVSVTAVQSYYRQYLDEAGLRSNKTTKGTGQDYLTYDELKSLSKEELIDELIRAKVEAERSKKGYTVKGGGQEKEFIVLNKQSSR